MNKATLILVAVGLLACAAAAQATVTTGFFSGSRQLIRRTGASAATATSRIPFSAPRYAQAQSSASIMAFLKHPMVAWSKIALCA